MHTPHGFPSISFIIWYCNWMNSAKLYNYLSHLDHMDIFHIWIFVLKYLMLRRKLCFWLTWGSKSSNPTKTLFHEKVPATVSFGSSISKPGKVHYSSEMHQEGYQGGVQVHNGYCNEIPQVLYRLLVGNFSKQFEQWP